MDRSPSSGQSGKRPTGTTSTSAAATAGRSSPAGATTSRPSAKPSAGTATRCPTCGRKYKRSTQANARYWLLLHLLSERLPVQGKTFSAETWHEYAKQRWIGCDDITLPNGKVVARGRSSAELDTAAFNDYMTQVEAWANEKGVYMDEME